MRLLLMALFILQGVSESAAVAQNSTAFDTFLDTYKASTATIRRQLAESFIRQRQAGDGVPIVEPDGRVVFLYVGDGDEEDVRLVGDFQTRSFYDIYWDEHGEEMTRAVPNDSLFFIRMKFEKDARLDYEFIVDGRHRNDPLNPRVVYSGTAPTEPGERVGTASELRMPGYRSTTVASPRDIAKGELQTIDEKWAQPKVTLYLPPSYDSEKTYPVACTTDGEAWLKYIDLPVILDNLIADHEIEPVIAVMVDAPKDRSAWYLFNPDYLTYLEKVVEHVDSNIRLEPGPKRDYTPEPPRADARLYMQVSRARNCSRISQCCPRL